MATACSDLREFLAVLRREKDLVEISAEVDPHLEAAEIHRRVIADGGPAILFTNIKGSPFHLVTNLFGTQKRVDLAFGSRPEEFIREIASLPETLMPPSAAKLWQHRSTLLDLVKVGLKRSRSAPVLEVAEVPPRLDLLPLLTTWEEDGGPFVTLPLVYTEHPRTKIHNLGMYRLQRFDAATTGFHCQIGKGGGFHLAAARELGMKLPVNVSIGGPPALILSAICPLPENVPELIFASLVLGKKLRLTDNPHGPLPIPADAEFTLVGEVDPNEFRPEGPFGDHYGYYSLLHDYPVFRCKALMHRKNPICTATVVGKPKQEDFFIGDYLQQVLSPLFPLVMPAVHDLWSYGETGYHSLAAASVRQRYKREAMVSAFRILGEGQLALTKFLLLTDARIDLKDFRKLLEHILARFDPRCDLFVFSNLAMDTLDYTGPKVNEGSKGVMLGCGDPIRELPRVFNGELPSGVSGAAPYCAGCLVLTCSAFSEDRTAAERIAGAPQFADWPLIVLTDDHRAASSSTSSFLWTTFTRFEPAADISAHHREILRNHIVYSGPVVIDARMKPWYPAELNCDPDTARLVDRRWREYFAPV